MLRVAPVPVLARVLAGLALAGCTPDPGDDDSGAESSGSTGEPVPTPAFLNPAVGSFVVDTNQTEPETFILQNAIPGLTQVLVDGYSLGLLPENDPVGTLTADSLILTLRGALKSGSHSLQLLTGNRFSVELEMKVVAPDPALLPQWTATLAPDVIATGKYLLSAGSGAGGLLGVVAPGVPDPELRLYRADAGGWSLAEPVVLPLEGHVLQDMPFGPALSAVAFPEPGGGAPKRMRVAYNVGWPAAAIHTRASSGPPSATMRHDRWCSPFGAPCRWRARAPARRLQAPPAKLWTGWKRCWAGPSASR